MASKLLPPLKPSAIETIAHTLGDTDRGLTGTKIHLYLLQAKIAIQKHMFQERDGVYLNKMRWRY